MFACSGAAGFCSTGCAVRVVLVVLGLVLVRGLLLGLESSCGCSSAAAAGSGAGSCVGASAGTDDSGCSFWCRLLARLLLAPLAAQLVAAALVALVRLELVVCCSGCFFLWNRLNGIFGPLDAIVLGVFLQLSVSLFLTSWRLSIIDLSSCEYLICIVPRLSRRLFRHVYANSASASLLLWTENPKKRQCHP